MYQLCFSQIKTPFADIFFDLLVCFQQLPSCKITYFVKLFDAHLHLILVPLDVIYVKYHIAQHIQVKAVICLPSFSSLLSGLFRHASQSAFYMLRQSRKSVCTFVTLRKVDVGGEKSALRVVQICLVCPWVWRDFPSLLGNGSMTL